MKVLLTGAAGFIGMHTALSLLQRGDEVVGVDNLNDYYDPKLKQARLEILQRQAGFQFLRLDLADRADVRRLFAEGGFDSVVHLAAQAGVRYSIENPDAYVDSNLVGFANVLEGCRHAKVKHLVYASSSSVYGGNTKLPFAEADQVDHPVSLYAATKKANELMAHTYSHLYAIPTTGLRFFTVYGPWGRPDMAYFLFAQAIVGGKPIKVFDESRMLRDFTYIDDIVEGVVRTLDRPPSVVSNADATHEAPYRVLNIGNNAPVALSTFIETLETKIGKKAERIHLPMQPGDVVATYADTSLLNQLTGFAPSTPLATGLGKFVDWYRSFYSV